MKLVTHFSDFLVDTVNLNQTRVQSLDDSTAAIKTFVQGSDWGPKIRRFVPQGSWSHGTIIKPVGSKPFDADLLVIVSHVEGWDPKRYLSELRRVFADDGRYAEKVRRFSHCITLEYAGERKIDIAPCVTGRTLWADFEVCNFDENAFELSEPEKFTAWLSERATWSGAQGLKKTTRLLKYLRDVKTTFTCPSFLLTTMLGERINWLDSISSEPFADVPTGLKTIVGRLDDWLQAQNSTPTVRNPVLQGEILSDVWTDAQFSNFREKIHDYRGWIDDAYNEADRAESIGKWQRVFGEEFAVKVVLEEAAQVSKAARDYLNTSSLTPVGENTDLIDLFRRFGEKAIPPSFRSLPHKQRPRWKKASANFTVSVVATLHTAKGGMWIENLTGSNTPLPADKWIQFQLRTSTGVPLANDYEIYWRITNTDQAAYKAKGLRGGFEKANDGTSHWERLEYRGVHTAEAFVVRKRDSKLVAESPIFFVPIA